MAEAPVATVDPAQDGVSFVVSDLFFGHVSLFVLGVVAVDWLAQAVCTAGDYGSILMLVSVAITCLTRRN